MPINSYRYARTNFFQIKPEKRRQFNKWISYYDIKIKELSAKKDARTPRAITLINEDCGGWRRPGIPEKIFDVDDIPRELRKLMSEGSATPPPVFDWIAEFLIPGQTAVFKEVSINQLIRYSRSEETAGGFIIAVNSNGETVRINLDDIYEQADKKFDGEKNPFTFVYDSPIQFNGGDKFRFKLRHQLRSPFV